MFYRGQSEISKTSERDIKQVKMRGQSWRQRFGSHYQVYGVYLLHLRVSGVRAQIEGKKSFREIILEYSNLEQPRCLGANGQCSRGNVECGVLCQEGKIVNWETSHSVALNASGKLRKRRGKGTQVWRNYSLTQVKTSYFKCPLLALSSKRKYALIPIPSPGRSLTLSTLPATQSLMEILPTKRHILMKTKF